MYRCRNFKCLAKRKCIFLAHEQWQYQGNGCQRISQLPWHLMELVCARVDVAVVVRYLDECSVNTQFDHDQCLKHLKTLLVGLVYSEEPGTQDAPTHNGDQEEFAKCFCEIGGVDILVRLLMFLSVMPKIMSKNKVVWESEEMLRLKSVLLAVFTKLTTMSVVGEKATHWLVEGDDMLNYVFALLGHPKTSVNACQLIEDMLQSRKDVFDLHRIHNLRALLSCFDDVRLANFCRILAVAMSDLDIYENKSSLYAQNKQKRSRGFVNSRDINQELLLAVPELLPRLVRIAVKKEYTPRYRGMVSELDCWMEWIENQMSEEVFEPHGRDDLDNFLGGISEPSSEGGHLVQQQGLRISEELVERVQVVYVLGLFLLGKHRKKVQRKLAELKLAPGLSDLFDQFIWKYQVGRHHTRHRLRGHNAACECSPEVALKIQFLRLVHSFCDHSEYKHLLLSKKELLEVKKINAQAGTLALSSLDSINTQLMCHGSKGLLSKIVDVMKSEPPTSTFRFWLARAVESYLRGDTSYCDQIFLIRRGLLEHVASNIMEHDIRHKEILQSSFDLLGELVKFNWDAFRTFDAILGSSDLKEDVSPSLSSVLSPPTPPLSAESSSSKLDKFTSTVNRNMVDSNMFIRSLVLSLEHFASHGVDVDTEKHRNRLVSYICDCGRQLDYLNKLIDNINVNNLTQENVSCLNTTLVFLMFAHKKGQLARYLRALSDRCATSDVTGSGNILRNFRDLLVFWQDHYLHKDKDCSALEKSSRIPFSYWKKTVMVLVSEDGEDPNSVSHYLYPLPASRTN